MHTDDDTSTPAVAESPDLALTADTATAPAYVVQALRAGALCPALRGGSGGTAPPPLDTQGICSSKFGQRPREPGTDGSPAVCPRSWRGCSGGHDGRALARVWGRCVRQRRRCRVGRGWELRHRLGRTRSMGWRPWVRAVAEELSALGRGDQAAKLLTCGATARVWTCGACGDPHASAEVVTSCDVRVCPWCARAEARARVALVSGAASRVADIVRARAATVGRALAEAHDLAAATRGRVAAERAAMLRRHMADVRAEARGGWRWRLVTVSPAWDPADPAEYTAAGLACRVDAVRATWRELWRRALSAGGLAAAYARVEISAGGHVHMHALHFGAYARADALSALAGCYVDVREVRARDGADPSTALDAAIREAVKYSLKSPSPIRDAWVAGDRWRVVHPELAARWTIATRRKRLCEAYGTMRDAIRAEAATREAPTGDVAGRACATCGATLDDDGWRTVAVATLAKSTARDWSRSRATTTPTGIVLPPRIAIVRGRGGCASRV